MGRSQARRFLLGPVNDLISCLSAGLFELPVGGGVPRPGVAQHVLPALFVEVPPSEQHHLLDSVPVVGETDTAPGGRRAGAVGGGAALGPGRAIPEPGVLEEVVDPRALVPAEQEDLVQPRVPVGTAVSSSIDFPPNRTIFPRTES
jgi:hypothetical protein